MAASKSKMNVWQLTILTAVNMMGSGIILLPAKLAEVGTISIFSWLITAGGSLALAYAFARCGMLSKKPGGMGGYSEYAFGKAGNYMANYTYGLSLVIGNVAIAVTAVGYGTVLFDATLTPIAICIWTIILLCITTFANFGGARITGRIGSVTVWGVIIPTVVISIIGWFWFSADTWARGLEPPRADLLAGGRQRHLHHALGVPGPGIGLRKCRCGREPGARRADCRSRWHHRRGRSSTSFRPTSSPASSRMPSSPPAAPRSGSPTAMMFNPTVANIITALDGDRLHRLAAGLAVHRGAGVQELVRCRLFPARLRQGDLNRRSDRRHAHSACRSAGPGLDDHQPGA